MAMAVGPSGSLKADINITPLVDVVLVLLIIFMVITPILQMGYDTKVPPKLESTAPPPPSLDQVILRLEPDGRMYINKEEVTESNIGSRLREVLKGRESKVTFFAAAGDLPYDRVIAFMDIVKESGAQNLGIVLEELGSQ
ncbi:MAG: biopolymer transporter ExbD [Acidobacteriota bacterium]